MTGNELKTFLEDLDWIELEQEIIFCKSKEGLLKGRSEDLSDISGAAVASGYIVFLSGEASKALQEELGVDFSRENEDEDEES